MKQIQAFWEIPGFWPMLTVLLIIAALSTLLITFGPDETGGQQDQDDPDLNDLQP